MRRTAVLLVALLTTAACSTAKPTPTPRPNSTPRTSATPAPSPTPVNESIYAHIGPGDMLPRLANLPARVYVPNSDSDSVDVIDPATMRIIDHFDVGKNPQHITPSWDMRTLYVNNDRAGSLTIIDPETGKRGRTFISPDPYNLYFTPDGSHAIVVSERLRRLDIRDPKTWKRQTLVQIPYKGPNHLDFSAEGRYLVISCEFSGYLVKVDLEAMKVVDSLHLGGKPVDVRLSPNGSVYYVANETRDGVSVVDAETFREIKFIPTGRGAHGFVVARDGKSLYVTNRRAGSISVIDFVTRAVTARWFIGGSPDMGGVTVDGRQLWVSGRYNSAVYVVDTTSGKRLATIFVGRGPHGLCVFPQPGRYSMGHTGNYR